MESRTAQWFICKVRYEKVMEDGSQKRITEQYVIDALSFTEAEERIIEEMSAYISGEFEVKDITLAPYREVFFSGEVADDRWYKAKVAFISIDEKTMKEKRSNVYYLVQAANMGRAVRNIGEAFGGFMLTYLISSITETSILDVFINNPQEDATDDGRGKESEEGL